MMCILDFDQRRFRHHHFDEPHDGLMQLRPPVAFGQHLDLGSWRNFDVERHCDQRQPLNQVGCLMCDGTAQAIDNDVVGVVATEIHQLPEELAPKCVGLGRRVRFTGGVQLAEACGGVTKRFQQPSLADTAFPDNIDQPAGARPRAYERLADDPSSAFRPVSGSRCSDTCRALILAPGPLTTP